MEYEDKQGIGLSKKRTSVVTNSAEIAEAALEQYQCDSEHRHVILEGGRANACEKYPNMLCEVESRAVHRESKNDSNKHRTRPDIGQLTRAEAADVASELNVVMNSIDALETIEDTYEGYEFFDDISNSPWDQEKAINGTSTSNTLLPSDKSVQ